MELRFAIVGCGKIAGRHARQALRVGTLAAVCDTDLRRAEALAAETGARAYGSLEELLAEAHTLDVASICTPNYLHAEQSIQCLQKGLHVLCEKPLAIRSEDARRMVDAAARHQRKLFVVKQNRYNPPVEWVKSLLRDNLLGRVHSFQLNGFWNRPDAYYADSWRGKRELDGGPLYTQFSHFIDLLYWFLGDVKSASTLTGNFLHPALDTEDCGVSVLEMASGAIGTLHFHVNAYRKNMEGSLTLFGERGSVKIGGEYLDHISYCQIEGAPAIPEWPSKPPNEYGSYTGSMSNHDKVYDQLVLALNDHGSGFASAQEGLKTVEIIEMVYAAQPHPQPPTNRL